MIELYFTNPVLSNTQKTYFFLRTCFHHYYATFMIIYFITTKWICHYFVLLIELISQFEDCPSSFLRHVCLFCCLSFSLETTEVVNKISCIIVDMFGYDMHDKTATHNKLGVIVAELENHSMWHLD